MTNAASDRFVRRPEVEFRTGLKRSTMYVRIKQGSFPCAFSKLCHPVSLNSVTPEGLPVSLKLPRWDVESRSPEARGGCSGCLVDMRCRSWCVPR
jgi:hypothetical protein